jgi:hypothetical protein
MRVVAENVCAYQKPGGLVVEPPKLLFDGRTPLRGPLQAARSSNVAGYCPSSKACFADLRHEVESRVLHILPFCLLQARTRKWIHEELEPGRAKLAKERAYFLRSASAEPMISDSSVVICDCRARLYWVPSALMRCSWRSSSQPSACNARSRRLRSAPGRARR